METYSALLDLCVVCVCVWGGSSVTGEFPLQWPVARRFDVSFEQAVE